MKNSIEMGRIGKFPVSIHRDDLANGNMTALGISGFGKTNMFKTLVAQVSKDESVIIPDTSESFDSLEDLKEMHVRVIDVYTEGLGIKPFEPIYFDENHKEKLVDVATRIASVLKSIYRLGGTQYTFLYKAIKSALQTEGDTNSKWREVLRILETQDDESAMKLSAKLEYLIDLDIFSDRQDFSPDILMGGGIILIKLKHFAAPEKRLIMELLLWEVWKVFQERQKAGLRTTLVFDECQTLDFSSESPISKFLTEGRKFGISCWLASQFFKDNFNAATVSRLEQAAVRLYFRPVESDIKHIADIIGDKDKKEWADKMRHLDIGEFIISGCYRLGGINKANDPIILKAKMFETDNT